MTNQDRIKGLLGLAESEIMAITAEPNNLQLEEFRAKKDAARQYVLVLVNHASRNIVIDLYTSIDAFFLHYSMSTRGKAREILLANLQKVKDLFPE